MINMIVSPHVYGRYRATICTERFLLIREQVQPQSGVTNVLATEVSGLG
ncbi:MAG: hypothetical protein KJ069_30405 [Anaerolineae bacterium]|nr:hypothetical protein [Anaerolineae bacterium]MCL4267525.1 hypothetical protein [Anaerolineae bacterium]